MGEVNLLKQFFYVKGKYIWNDGSQYQGDWKENKITGQVSFVVFLK